MSRLYFNKTLFTMRMKDKELLESSQGWIKLCNGRKVHKINNFVYGCMVEEYGEFHVLEHWCTRRYPRRKALANYNRKHGHKKN